MRSAEKLVWVSAAVMFMLFLLDVFGVARFSFFGLPFCWHYFPEIALCFLCGWIFRAEPSKYPKRYVAGVVACSVATPVIISIVFSAGLDVVLILFLYALAISAVPVSLGYALSKLFSRSQKKFKLFMEV